ncbi:MFS transporter, partial [Streptomyces wedmorensis]
MSHDTTAAAGPVTRAPEPDEHPPSTGRLPLPALLALATAVFVTSLTETLPAGLLPAMSAGLGVGEAATGQAVTVYALGTALTAIPLAARTAAWRRKRLLLTSVAGFAAANTVTAASSSYALTMGARFLAGVAAGVAWALLAGYARRLAPAHLQGRAVAVAMTGIPLALSLGVPAGTFLGEAAGWRTSFAAMTVIAAALLAWIALAVPDLPGEPRGARAPAARTLAVPGVLPVLTVTFVLVLAHTVP